MDLTSKQIKQHAVAFKAISGSTGPGAADAFCRQLAGLLSDVLQAEYHERCNTPGKPQDPGN